MSDFLIEVKSIRPFKAKSGPTSLKAFADIVFNKQLVVCGMKVLLSKKGELFVGWPSKTTNDKENPYRDIVYATDKDVRVAVSELILEAYENNIVNKSDDDEDV